MVINMYLSIISLNVNGLQSKDREWQTGIKKKKKEPTIHCLQESYLRAKGTIN